MRNTILRDSLLGLFVFSAFVARSQNVGINLLGSTPNACTILDLNTGVGGHLGFLAPQASLASNVDVATIPAPAIGLIVYNTNAAMVNGNGTGYYYYSSVGAWAVMSGPQGNWLLTGNVGTAPATNWLGTNDANAFQFKVDGTKSGWIDYLAAAANTSLGFKAGNVTTGANNLALGYLALELNTTGASNTAVGYSALINNTTAAANTATGYDALYFNSTGGSNTANGYQSLNNNTTGSNNTAIGLNAIQANSTANGNAAVGAFALQNSTFGFNTAVGFQAGQANTLGQSNTYIGAVANANAGTYTNSSAIGANTFIGASNAMQLGAVNGLNSGIADVKVGIGTNIPTQKLNVNNGNILISNGAIGGDLATVGQMQFQDATGSAGYSSFQAGAQGVTNYNYIMPITAPTVGYLLQATTYAAPNAQLGYNIQPSGVLIGLKVITVTMGAAVTFDAGTTFIIYKILGGGGAGGGADFTTVGGCIASTASVSDMAGGGGGAGAYSEGEVTGITVATTYSVIIGAGGVGQAACNQPLAGYGGTTQLVIAGGPVITLKALGGFCGTSLEIKQSVGSFGQLIGGAGGFFLNIGALNVQGGTGGWANVTQNGTDAVESGTGASSIFGGGGSGFEERDVQSETGNPASAYGSGGSGGTYPGVTVVNSTCTGGNGSPGIVIIYEYQ